MQEHRVLVVDDGEDDRFIIGGFLVQAGFTVQTTCCGPDALQKIHLDHYDAIVIDLAMPGMDGLQLLAHIRDLPGGTHLPLIAVTAYYSSDVRHACLRAGFDAYIPKPVHESRFAETVQALIQR